MLVVTNIIFMRTQYLNKLGNNDLLPIFNKLEELGIEVNDLFVTVVKWKTRDAELDRLQQQYSTNEHRRCIEEMDKVRRILLEKINKHMDD